MEDQVIVWEMPDSSVRYATCPVNGKKPGEMTEEWLLRIFQKTVRDSHPGARRILNALMPGGQPFRPGAAKLYYGAWRNDGAGKIKIDMPVARDIRLNEIRAERNRRLEDSDKEWLRILDISTSDQQNSFKAYRQALRDIPQGIDLGLVDDPEALEAFQPAWPTRP